jgi:hypothetical protein
MGQVRGHKVHMRRGLKAHLSQSLALERLCSRTVDLEHLQALAEIGASESEGIHPGTDQHILYHALVDRFCQFVFCVTCPCKPMLDLHMVTFLTFGNSRSHLPHPFSWRVQRFQSSSAVLPMPAS